MWRVTFLHFTINLNLPSLPIVLQTAQGLFRTFENPTLPPQ